MDSINSLTSELSTNIKSLSDYIAKCDHSRFSLEKADQSISAILRKSRELVSCANRLYGNLDEIGSRATLLVTITSIASIIVTNSKAILIIIQAKNDKTISHSDYRVITELVTSLDQLIEVILEADQNYVTKFKPQIAVIDGCKPHHIEYNDWHAIIAEINSDLRGLPNRAVEGIIMHINAVNNYGLNFILVESLSLYLKEVGPDGGIAWYRNSLKLKKQIQNIPLKYDC